MPSFPTKIFFIALIIRLIPVYLLRHIGIGLDDMFQYDMLARSIVSGDGFRWYAQPDLNLLQGYFTTLQFQLPADYDPRGIITSFRPPLYSAFLALIYFFSGVGADRFLIARVVQTFLGAALVPLTYLIARRVFPDDERIAKYSAWTLVFYPLLVLYPISLATENLFFVLVLISILLLLKAQESRLTKHFIFAGICIGLTVLTRSTFLIFGGFAALWAFFLLKEKKNAIILFVCISLTIAPWVIRNSLLHHQLTGVESSLGYNLYMGYHPESTGTFEYGTSLDLLPYLDDGVRDKIGQTKAGEFIRAEPSRVPYLAVRRLGYFFGLERRALTYFYSNNFFGFIPTPLLYLSAIILLMPFIIICLSAAFGVALTKWNSASILLALLFLGYLAPHVIILAEDRFHLALVPFIAIFGANFWMQGFASLRLRWRESRAAKFALTFAALAACLLILNWGLELYLDLDKLILLFGPNGNQSYFSY